jgi:hypothetical protein
MEPRAVNEVSFREKRCLGWVRLGRKRFRGRERKKVGEAGVSGFYVGFRLLGRDRGIRAK